jgi:hypothetical protein
MAQADYCHDPIDSLMVWVAPSSTSRINQYVSYYLTCTGASPFHDTIYGVQYLLKELDFYLSYLSAGGSGCLDSDSYSSLHTSIASLTEGIFPELFTLLSCEDYSHHWAMLTYEEVCGSMVNGLFSIWIVQLAVNGFLVCILIYSSYLYPYLQEVGYHQRNRQGSELQQLSEDRALTTAPIVSPLSLQVSKVDQIEMM